MFQIDFQASSQAIEFNVFSGTYWLQRKYNGIKIKKKPVPEI